MKNIYKDRYCSVVTRDGYPGQKGFNWLKFLNKRSHTPKEQCDAARRAATWVTCACGNLCNIIPRGGYGQPLDAELHELGCEFTNDITDGHYKDAKVTLLRIENRAGELIKEIHQND